MLWACGKRPSGSVRAPAAKDISLSCLLCAKVSLKQSVVVRCCCAVWCWGCFGLRVDMALTSLVTTEFGRVDKMCE
jgi:hypothetical protein